MQSTFLFAMYFHFFIVVAIRLHGILATPTKTLVDSIRPEVLITPVHLAPRTEDNTVVAYYYTNGWKTYTCSEGHTYSTSGTFIRCCGSASTCDFYTTCSLNTRYGANINGPCPSSYTRPTCVSLNVVDTGGKDTKTFFDCADFPQFQAPTLYRDQADADQVPATASTAVSPSSVPTDKSGGTERYPIRVILGCSIGLGVPFLALIVLAYRLRHRLKARFFKTESQDMSMRTLPATKGGRFMYADYTVAIICPLEVEMSAVRYMLEAEHPKLPSMDGDSNRYIFGEMSGHNVVIGFLPEGSQGIGAAANVATDMRRTFSAIQLRLLVGIGGGVPSREKDIRLGDVVVGMPSGAHGGVVQYDLGQVTTMGFTRKGFLMPPPRIWRDVIVEMKSDHRVSKTRIPEYLSNMISRYPQLGVYPAPSPEKDILFLPNYVHTGAQNTCERCDKAMAIPRRCRDSNAPVIFYGLIASGNRVIESATTRDRISRDVGGVLCFEMEAAGLVNDFQCIVIRGIADYADSHKNEDWHLLAAAAAAGCAKELLSYMSSIANTAGVAT